MRREVSGGVTVAQKKEEKDKPVGRAWAFTAFEFECRVQELAVDCKNC